MGVQKTKGATLPVWDHEPTCLPLSLGSASWVLLEACRQVWEVLTWRQFWAALGKNTTEGYVGAVRRFHWWSRTRPRDESWTARSSLEAYLVQLAGEQTFDGPIKKFVSGLRILQKA